jgi:hypothetical protein
MIDARRPLDGNRTAWQSGACSKYFHFHGHEDEVWMSADEPASKSPSGDAAD